MKSDDATTLRTDDSTTLSEEEADEDSPDVWRPALDSTPERLALVLAWSKDEPWRIGEVLMLPSESGAVVWLGRGSSDAGGGPPKGTFGQQRPGQWLPCPMIAAPAISRYQISFRLAGDVHVAHNEGRCAVFRNDVETTDCELAAGDLLQLGKQVLLLCCRRPAQMPGEAGVDPSFPFGMPDPHDLVGESAAIWQLRRQIMFVAARPGHVLIAGPSGSGKELVARAIHALSSRRDQRMVSRNAATLPEALIDAELFGNAKSYPNPGMSERPGLVGEAHGSTLFLDELAELPHGAQAHLLRVLDHGEYQRLGDAHGRVSDFRLVAATNRELASLKPDLLARFTFRIEVPDLNARKEDVPLLVRHALRRMAEQGDAAALELFPGRDPRAEPRLPLPWMFGLLAHRYQTNVRELDTMLLEALATPAVATTWSKAEDDREPDDLSPSGSSRADPAERIRQCLDANNGSIERTWRALGLSSRFSLLRMIKKYRIEVRRRPAGHERIP